MLPPRPVTSQVTEADHAYLDRRQIHVSNTVPDRHVHTVRSNTKPQANASAKRGRWMTDDTDTPALSHLSNKRSESSPVDVGFPLMYTSDGFEDAFTSEVELLIE